jgi:hypothetical protein
MAVTSLPLVVYEATTRKHQVLGAGDQIPGTSVQLSTDAGNAVSTGTDGGLKVLIPAQLPDDQVLSGDNSGNSAVTLTPTVVGGDTNYVVKVDVKLAAAQATGANQLVQLADKLYVAPEVTGATAAPTTTNDGTTPTEFFGNNTKALGTPAGWFEVMVPSVGAVKVPYYS